MFLTVHATAAALIGEQTQSISLAFILGLLSHLILDMIPHGDEVIFDRRLGEKVWKRRLWLGSTLDTLGVAILTMVLWKNNLINLSGPTISCLIGSLLPDYLFGFKETFKLDVLLNYPQKIFTFFHDFFKVRISPLKGALVQIIILTIFIYLLTLNKPTP
ncbi:hypothetical protein KKF32_01515 [Patescibacteria group bacterium]|nr:hypothetical protein [Patescibacteria group bacterium]